MTPTFIASQLWLDFVNTEMGAEDERTDLLESVEALRTWMSLASTVHEGIDAPRRDYTKEVLDEALRLRSTLRRIASAAVGGRRVAAGAVEEVNAALRRGLSFPQIVPTEAGLAMRNVPAGDDHLRPLQPLARSVGEFLVQGDASRIRQCQAARCVLFFYDTTKNHGRRFCNPETCGSRTRAARYYGRQTGR